MPNSKAADYSSAHLPTISIVVLADNDSKALGRILEQAKEALAACDAVGEILVVGAGAGTETDQQVPVQGID